MGRDDVLGFLLETKVADYANLQNRKSGKDRLGQDNELVLG